MLGIAFLFLFLSAQGLLLAGSPGNQSATGDAGRKAHIRKAFVMSVNPGQESEYEKRHRLIWPELEATLKEHGW